MAPTKMVSAVLCALMLAASFSGIAAQSRAPAPAPGQARSNCSLPSGQTVSALTGTSEQWIGYYSYSYTSIISYAYTSISYGYYYGCGCYGRKLLGLGGGENCGQQARKLLQRAPAPAPIGPLNVYPRCCPSRITLSGDTVSSLVNDKELTNLFYAINPDVTPSNAPDAPLTAGQNVTVPCSRIISLGTQRS